MTLKYHITASGSDEHPDLDYEADEVRADLYSKYRYINVAILMPISLQAIRSGMDGLYDA